MSCKPLVLVDRLRAEQFARLGAIQSGRRLFDGHRTWTDDKGIVWAGKYFDHHVFAVTWLGPGWVLDPEARRRQSERLARQYEIMAKASSKRHARELQAVFQLLHLGPHIERLLWLIHAQLVLGLRKSVLLLPDYLLAEVIWRR